MAIHGKVKVGNTLVPYNPSNNSSTAQLMQGCELTQISAELFQPIRLDIDLTDVEVSGGDYTVNGNPIENFMQSNALYDVVPGSGIIKLVNEPVGGGTALYSSTEFGSGTICSIVITNKTGLGIPNGSTESISFGFQRAVWNIGNIGGNVIVQSATWLGYGPSVQVELDDVLEIEQTINKIIFRINGVIVNQVPIQVQMTCIAGLGTLTPDGVFVDTGTNVQFIPKSISSGQNNGSIAILFSDNLTSATLNVSIEQFSITSPVQPSQIIAGVNIPLATSTNANWSILPAGGTFLPDANNENNVVFNSTGLPPGVYTITANCACNPGQTDTFQITVYDNIEVSPNSINDCVAGHKGIPIEFLTTLGSENYSFTVSYPHTLEVDETVNGKFRVIPGNSSSGTVTIIDTVTQEVVTVQICVESQDEFCAIGEVKEVSDTSEKCCRIVVDVDDTVVLKFPSLLLTLGESCINSDSKNTNIVFNTLVQGTENNSGTKFSQFVSTGLNAGAIANELNQNDFIIQWTTSQSQASLLSGEVAIGISSNESSVLFNNLDYSLVYLTVAGIRYVELRKDNVQIPGTRYPIATHDNIAIGRNGSDLVYFIKGLQKTIPTQVLTGNYFLILAAKQSGIVFGGEIIGGIWEKVTDGDSASTGTLNPVTGEYDPGDTNFPTIELRYKAGESIFEATVRVVRPTVSIENPLNYLHQSDPRVWINSCLPTFRQLKELPVVASDGSPDYNMFPGFKNLQRLKEGAEISFDISNNERTANGSVIGKLQQIKSAMIKGTFLEVLDFKTLASLLPNTVYKTDKGCNLLEFYEFGCNQQFHIWLVVPILNCGERPHYLIAQFFRASPNSTPNFKFNSNEETNLPFEFTGYPEPLLKGMTMRMVLCYCDENGIMRSKSCGC